MVFSSYRFIFLFLPVCFIVYRLLALLPGKVAPKVWLVAASLFFYAQGGLRLLPLLAGTLVFNYAAVRLLDRDGAGKAVSRLVLAAALAENLGLLFYYKYFNFFISNVNFVFGTDFLLKTLILPLGISFYTFLMLGYVIDVYRKKSKCGPFLDYALFVTFFPRLIVGPIGSHDDFAGRLNSGDFKKFDAKNIMLGLLLFSIGCAKKILMADTLINHAQGFYNSAGGGNFFEAWGGVVSYTFAYYFDFSGYCDMAVGLGLFFNIRLPFNFNSPYKARDFADFWRRWNITVSKFFNDHVFSNIFHFGNPLRRHILAVFATFAVSGLWHGAGWHFIFWGIANGALVCVANIMTIKRKKLPAGLAWAGTFFMALLIRVLFDSSSMGQALGVYAVMFDVSPLFSATSEFIAQGAVYFRGNVLPVALMLAGAAICFFAPNTKEISESFAPKLRYAALSGVLLTVSLFFMGQVSSFLYFQF